MTAWRIDLLGGFQFRREGEVIAFPNRKDRLLLAFLALRSGRSMPRDRLAGLLWGDRGEEQARASLRQSLAGIREAFGNGEGCPLVGTREHVTLQQNADLAIDTLEFDRLRGEEGGAVKALLLYTGPLLDGFHGPSPDYDQWLASERVRFEEEAATLASKLPVSALTDDDMQLVLGRTRELLLRDRLREPLYQLSMRVLARQRNWPEVARVYKDCCAALEEELGVAPTDETTEVYRSLTAARNSPQPPVSAPVHREERPAVAVMPFQNLSTDEHLNVLCEGLAEEITVGLGAFRLFSVIDRHSAREVAKLTSDAKEMGARLGVTLIVQGSLQRIPDGFRLLVKLVEPETRTQRWAGQFQVTEAEVLSAPHKIVAGILTSINAQVETSLLLRSRKKVTLASYEHLLLGVQHLRGYERDDNLKAVRHFDLALEADQRFALAQAYRGFADIVINDYSACPSGILQSAIRRIRKAAELEPDEPRIWWLLGLAVSYAGDLAAEERCFQRAAELNPNDANNLATLGHVTVAQGRKSEGIALFERAFRLNPYHPEWYWVDYGNALYLCERYEEALQAFCRRTDPAIGVLCRIAACCAQLGRVKEAGEVVGLILKQDPGFCLSAQKMNNWCAGDVEMFRLGMLKAGLPA